MNYLTDKQVFQLRHALKKFGHCQVENIIRPQLAQFLNLASHLMSSYVKEENNPVVLTKNKHSKKQYAPIIGESLFACLTPIYSQISGKELIPTYSFFRTYYKGGTLTLHKDRPACQYSATIQIDSKDKNIWPIFIKDKKGIIQECKASWGDVIWYKGEEVEHWREELDFEYSSHLFMHWVDKNDSNYTKYQLDGRNSLGDPWLSIE